MKQCRSPSFQILKDIFKIELKLSWKSYIILYLYRFEFLLNQLASSDLILRLWLNLKSPFFNSRYTVLSLMMIDDTKLYQTWSYALISSVLLTRDLKALSY